MSLRSSPLSADFAVLHAPCQPCKDRDYEEWWIDTAILVGQHFVDHSRLVVLCDANTDAGRGDDLRTGGLHASDDTPRSVAFVDFLENFSLFLPATFERFQGADQPWTAWASNFGTHRRIDHVALPLEWCSAVSQTWVDDRVDVSTVKEDHSVPSAQVQVPDDGCDAVAVYARRKTCCDVAKLKDPVVIENLRQRLVDAPIVPWEFEPSSHLHIVNEYIRESLTEVAPPRLAPKRPHWMTNATLALADEKSGWSRTARKLTASLRRNSVHRAFAAWRSGIVVSAIEGLLR